MSRPYQYLTSSKQTRRKDTKAGKTSVECARNAHGSCSSVTCQCKYNPK